ncbi:MAG: protein kinase [Myxococcaceae bacterium]
MSQGSASQRLRPFRPQPFGRYILLMPLSTGGMGEIFLAQLMGSHGFDKLCVIKKILPHLAQDQDFVGRFIDEARILVKLSHGNIAQVLDMGVEAGAPYIALEFVDGKDLRRVVSRMRDRSLALPLSFVLSVMVRVLDALAYAHRKRGDDDRDLNLVHRDVSPQNVLISYEGEVKVIDFGLAKSAMSVSKTNPSIVLGKFMYMSPEQARHKPVDRRSDLYAVGLVLWELVTGKNPFEDVPSGELMAKVGNPTIPPLNTVEPLCPSALSDAVGKALAIDPAQRFQTAEEFRGRLQSILQDIDPLAGAESTSRFMRDAFAAEYQAERRMLTTVKDQARALQPDDEPAGPAEETAQNMPSPFASAPRPTPIATPAVTMSEETPLGGQALLPPETQPLPVGVPAAPGQRIRADPMRVEALSFAPTPKAGPMPGVPPKSKSNDVHEKETLPAILVKPDAPKAEPSKPRAVAKLFDQESTEAATPAIAEPVAQPSVMLEGVEGELPANTLDEDSKRPTELEVPAAVAAPPSPPRKKAPAAPKGGTAERKAASKPPKANGATAGERPKPKAPPPPVQRTDTMVIRNPIADKPSAELQAQLDAAAAPPAKKKTSWVWLLVPLIAVAGVVAFIAYDLTTDKAGKGAAETEVVDGEPAEEINAPDEVKAPAPKEDAPKEAAKDLAPDAPKDVVKEPAKDPKVEAPKSAPKAAPKKAASGGSPGEVALRALKSDYEKLVDENVQRQFKLKIHAFEGDVGDKGEDPGFVAKIESLHDQVKVALQKQQ